MSINFNHNFTLTYNPHTFMQKFVQPTYYSKEPIKDTFVKNVAVDNSQLNNNFDGIEIKKKSFGKIEKTGENATLYTITNKNGASVSLSSFGATITSIKIPDKEGNLIDVAQGYEDVAFYEKYPTGHAGGTIGPCANKINNGQFKLNNKEYKLDCNKDNGKTHSHGGKEGLDLKNWKSEILKDGIKFSYTKKDMENGYPANVNISVTYKFDNNNNLSVHYQAESDDDTILNLTNHSYFNLDGAHNTEENSVMEHVIQMPNSSKYTPTNDIAIPTGEIKSVENTLFDFREGKKLSEMDKNGYDQNFVIDGYDGKKMIVAAKVKSEKTGIGLNVSTNLPAFQFYTANNLGKSTQPEGKDGKKYEKHSSLCIEPQFFPDAINTFDEKPILKKGEKYDRTIIYSFTTDK